MKNIRFFFKKDGFSRFMSHLDTYRAMLRAMRRTELPIWYTEGFNVHPFMTFSLPLSLGIRGLNESFDIKLENDNFLLDKPYLIKKLNSFLPDKIEITSINEPIMKPKEITYADFKIDLIDENRFYSELKDRIEEFLNQKEITVVKKSKSGEKNINLKDYIKRYKIKVNKENNVTVELILPAGNDININPLLLINAINDFLNTDIFYDITRVKLLNKDLKLFQ